MEEQMQSDAKRSGVLQRCAGPVILFILVTVFYSPSAQNDFIYDDRNLITAEPTPESLSDFGSIFQERYLHCLPYYRPVSRLTMVTQKCLHGDDDAAAYHLANAALMGCLAALMCVLLRAPAFSIPPALAFLGAGFAALHPAASSTVYPISGREALLTAVFAVAAVRCYVAPGRIAYLAALVFLGLGLLSREQAVVVPFLFFFADMFGLSAAGRPRNPWAWVVRYGPVALVTAAYLLVRSSILAGGEGHQLALIEQPIGPFLSVAYAFQTALTPFATLVYEPSALVWASLWRGVVTAVLLLLAALFAYRCWPVVQNRFLFWLGWAIFALAPTANILQQETPYAERHLLLFLLGAIGMAVTLVSAAWDRASLRPALLGVGVVLLAGCVAITWQRGHYYRDDETFYHQWVAANPESSQAQYCLGIIFLLHEDWDRAQQQYETALRLEPGHALAMTRLGEVFARKGDVEQALALLRRAEQLRPDDPESQYQLGHVLIEAGSPEEGAVHLRQALSLDPNHAKAHYQLGKLLNQSDRLEEAQIHFELTLRMRPDHVEAWTDLGTVIARLGGRDSEQLAYGCFRNAIELDPEFEDAYYNLGVWHITQGQLSQAQIQLETALRLDPNHTYARDALEHIRTVMQQKE